LQSQSINSRQFFENNKNIASKINVHSLTSFERSLMKKHSTVLMLLMFAAMSLTANATTYYASADGDVTDVTKWWTVRGGTGTHPSNFTTAGDIFIVENDVIMSLNNGNSWTVTGSVVLEDYVSTLSVASNAGTLTVGALTVSGQFICSRPVVVNGATIVNSNGLFNLKGNNQSTTFADVTIGSATNWTIERTGASTITINGNFTNNASGPQFTPSSSLYQFSGSGKTLSGTIPIPRVEFTGNYTNSGTLTDSSLTVTGAAIRLTNNGTVSATYYLEGTGGVTQGSSGILNIGGTSGITTLDASTNAGNIVNYTGSAQTGKVATYRNLTLSGSGAKTFATTPTVNGILSLEGTASIVVTSGVVTYGSGATLQYNKSAAYSATPEEWISPFTATGGIIIANTGAITPVASTTIGAASMLTIKSGASIVTNSPTYTTGAKLKYDGASTQTTTAIELPGTMAGSVVINNTAGVNLGGSTTLNGTLTFTAGNLTLGASTLTLGGSVSGAAEGACVVTNSTGIVSKSIANGGSFTFPIGPTATNYNPVSITNNSGGAVVYTALIKSISPAAPTPANGLNYMWTLTGSAGSATLSFTWSNGDAGSGLAATPTSGTAWMYSANWTEVGGSTAGGTPNVTSGVTTSNPAANWTIGLTGALPVELTSFNAIAHGNRVELVWKTATEMNNYGFEIERAIDTGNLTMDSWSKIGFVEGNGTTNSPKSYSFVDNLASGKISYRLKQIDRDGKFEYSKTVEVTATGTPKAFGLEQNYPNPFNPSTVISYQLPMNSHVSMKVFDAIGREVAALVNETKDAGRYEVIFSAPQLASGIYLCRLTADGYSRTIKISLVR
jgi:hypothetical protein